MQDGQFGIESFRYRQGDRERVRQSTETMSSYQAPIPAYAESTLSPAGV